MKKKDTIFTPSSDFIVKRKRNKKIISNVLYKDLVKELQALKTDNFTDIDVYIEDENIHLRHKAIIRTLAPNIYSNLGLALDSNLTLLNIKEFEESIPPNQRELLKIIYGSTLIQEGMEMDLTSLLENGDHSDVTFKVDEDLFTCHKCILSARSEFFMMMFRGNWMETNLDVVPLKNITHKTFCFVLKAIYNGGLELPDEADIGELVAVSEMYEISCLKRVLQHHLKSNSCHFFHMPCQFCIAGVLDVLYLCNNFLAYKNLVRDCYNWFLRYYAKIFLSKNFLKAPQLVKDNISDKIKESVRTENVLQHIQDCIQVKARLPRVNTVETVKVLVSDIQEYCLKFVSNNMKDLTQHSSFMYSVYDDKNINKHLILHECLTGGLSRHVNQSNCVHIYQCALFIETTIEGIPETDRNEATENSVQYSSNLKDLSKKFIRRNLMKVKKTSNWNELSTSEQKDIMDGSGFVAI